MSVSIHIYVGFNPRRARWRIATLSRRRSSDPRKNWGYIYKYTFVNIYMSVCVLCAHTYMYICVYISIHKQMTTSDASGSPPGFRSAEELGLCYTSTSLIMYMCVCVCIYICVYIYIYIYTNIIRATRASHRRVSDRIYDHM